MLLGVKERFLLAKAIPPQSGNWSKLRIVEKLRTDLLFTEAEFEEFGLEDDPERMQLRWQKDGEREVDIGPVAYRVIINSLKALAKANVLSEDFLTLSGKFPEAEKESLEEEALEEDEAAQEEAQRIVDSVPVKEGDAP